MTLEEAVVLCERVKNTPSDPDELLDFIVKCYIQGEITISQYRTLYRQLDAAGAKKPQYELDNQPDKVMK